ncbi:MAG TPA: DUF2461 domain-containing protein [Chitinophagaceae bacterium]|nr:DUF2461 domain-containing protein [Chitinophagaceae bacterium]
MQTAIHKETIDFLKALAKNNNREWFNNHKTRYTNANNNMIAFADALLAEMNKHDKIETPSGKDSLFRIYRDVRFSADKTPYQIYFSGGFKRATQRLRGGYYFHIEPGNSYVGGGFWGPNTDDLKRIRQDIDYNYPDWEKLLSDKSLIKTFGGLQGEQLSSAPRGYAKDHPAINLLRYKQFILKHTFAGDEICSPAFAKSANEVFKKMRPFFDFMSDLLTTDANGVPGFD